MIVAMTQRPVGRYVHSERGTYRTYPCSGDGCCRDCAIGIEREMRYLVEIVEPTDPSMAPDLGRDGARGVGAPDRGGGGAAEPDDVQDRARKGQRQDSLHRLRRRSDRAGDARADRPPARLRSGVDSAGGSAPGSSAAPPPRTSTASSPPPTWASPPTNPAPPPPTPPFPTSSSATPPPPTPPIPADLQAPFESRARRRRSTPSPGVRHAPRHAALPHFPPFPHFPWWTRERTRAGDALFPRDLRDRRRDRAAPDRPERRRRCAPGEVLAGDVRRGRRALVRVQRPRVECIRRRLPPRRARSRAERHPRGRRHDLGLGRDRLRKTCPGGRERDPVGRAHARGRARGGEEDRGRDHRELARPNGRRFFGRGVSR